MEKHAPLRWRKAGLWTLRLFALGLILASLSSVIRSDEWWVRIWDFPRAQIAIAMVIFTIALLVFERGRARLLVLPLAVCAFWQSAKIYPYTSFANPEVAQADTSIRKSAQCFSAMAYNVQQTNRDYATSIAMLERENPEILLLLETDEAWITALQPVLARYPETISEPLDNAYGLALAARMPMRKSSVQDLAEPKTPSVFATVETPGSNTTKAVQFHIVGLHPRPPRPGQDTEERDAELIIAARHAAKQNMPGIALGDFNDVAWAETSSLFKRIGGFLDPRVGRGTYATFPAGQTWLGWPLDHVFVTEHFVLDDLRVLENTGSDHRAIIARLCLDPNASARNALTPIPDEDDREQADDVIEEYEEYASQQRERS